VRGTLGGAVAQCMLVDIVARRVQVVMDVLGVAITCVVCTLVLDPGIHPSLRHRAAVAHLPAGHMIITNHT
jgi:hypothetical protein